jgi:TorA maturation chaperone TorD
MLNLHKLRRGQVFSFTLTELILLILFILLLLLWFITDKKDEEIAKWSNVTGTNTPEEYESLYPNFPDKTTTPDLQDRLITANKEIERLKQENEKLREIVSQFKDKTGKDDPSEIPKIAESEEGLGRLPPCWPKGWTITKDPNYKRADRIFNVLFISADKLAVIPGYASGYEEQYNLLRFNKNVLSTESDFKNNTLNIINSNQFVEAFEPLLQDSKKAISIEHNNLTLRRDCRHEVNVFDSPTIDKKEYKRLNDRIIESIFTTYGYNDPYSYYLIHDRPK